MAFDWNWKTRDPRPNPYLQVGDLSTMNANSMAGYTPLIAFTPDYSPATQMAGYNPVEYNAQRMMQGYHPNAVDPRDPNAVQYAQNAEYGAALQAASEAAGRRQQIEQIDQQIEANNAQIAQLKQQLAQLTNGSSFADDFDRRLAQNRAGIGDMANAQMHLSRIEARKQAEETRKNAEHLRMMDKLGKNGEEFDELMKLAKMRTNLEAVAKDPGLRSGLEREYNIAVQQYRNKYGRNPDFANFEGKVDLFYDRSGYKGASDEDLAKDKSTLSNFITNNTDANGRWKGGDEELKRAIAAAEKQGDASLAKQLRNTWTPAQYYKYVADMNRAGEKALGGFHERQVETAKRNGKFTDKQNRSWVMKNGKWTSADYKWSGKRNGV